MTPGEIQMIVRRVYADHEPGACVSNDEAMRLATRLRVELAQAGCSEDELVQLLIAFVCATDTAPIPVEQRFAAILTTVEGFGFTLVPLANGRFALRKRSIH